MILTYQIILLVAAIGFYMPTQLWLFEKLKWTDPNKPYSFWGAKSDYRKYVLITIGKETHKTTNPKFPGSTGPLVFLTDGYHLFQFLSWRCIYMGPWPFLPHIPGGL